MSFKHAMGETAKRLTDVRMTTVLSITYSAPMTPGMINNNTRVLD